MRLWALATLAALGTACGANAAAPSPPPRDLNVFAAASLTAAFTSLGTSFESSHRQVRVRFDFAGSSTLVQQIHEGAPADVFAAGCLSGNLMLRRQPARAGPNTAMPAESGPRHDRASSMASSVRT